MRVDVLGGGLAGSEAAWQLTSRGVTTRLWEMRPDPSTGAHVTGQLAELVCSNSLGSDVLGAAGGVLKAELRVLGSLVIEQAERARVPAGSALAVDRDQLSAGVEERLEGGVEVRRREAQTLFPDGATASIVATGPLTSDALAQQLANATGEEHLYFYDAIAPIIDAESLDMDQLFRASRRETGAPGDYLNIPLDQESYEAFVDRLLAAERLPAHPFEEERLFEGCQPIESIAQKGRESLRFGPMRPVGLFDPKTGQRPHAVIQLRAENAEGSAFGPVGFQTRLKHGEQRALLRSLPGLHRAEFLRLGSIHRNTYLDAPKCLDGELRLAGHPHVRVAGQLAGCEGYAESVALGLMAGLWTAAEVLGRGPLPPPPPDTVIGALLAYLRQGSGGHFAPMNANFGLLPAVPHSGRKLRRRERRLRMAERAVEAIQRYREQVDEILGLGS